MRPVPTSMSTEIGQDEMKYFYFFHILRSKCQNKTKATRFFFQILNVLRFVFNSGKLVKTNENFSYKLNQNWKIISFIFTKKT